MYYWHFKHTTATFEVVPTPYTYHQDSLYCTCSLCSLLWYPLSHAKSPPQILLLATKSQWNLSLDHWMSVSFQPLFQACILLKTLCFLQFLLYLSLRLSDFSLHVYIIIKSSSIEINIFLWISVKGLKAVSVT